jgi:transposase
MRQPAVDASEHTTRVAQLERELSNSKAQIDTLTQQLDWFKRQLFGRKSEKRLLIDPAHQPLLDGLLDEVPSPSEPEPCEQISYERRKRKTRDEDCVTEQGLRFDASVPVETIMLSAPQLHGAQAEDWEVIAYKRTRRLAQRPGSYVVLEYVRPVLRQKSSATMLTVPAPSALWEGTFADVSLIAGLIQDKCAYYLPLYRQHQRLAASGITLSRQLLSTWVHRAAELLRPVHEAQLRSILQGKVLAMDDTPIRAGRDHAKHKMKRAYLWPVYGDRDEVSFTFSTTHGRVHVLATLGGFAGTLLCDGHEAYLHYARVTQDVTHAQCWAHTRRYFERAESAEPQAVAEALALIGELYRVETHIRKEDLSGEAKLACRIEQARPVLDAFFEWCQRQCHRIDLMPKNPLSIAIGYAMQRRGALSVYLSDPEVAIDTNHIERAIRPIAIARKNWIFCWTEIGAERLAILHSLVATCRLHRVHPYTYLVDVLQRVAIHPASAVEELTPRRWAALFADNPLRSDLEHAVKDVA